jgi:hypothetical protein
LRRNSGRRDDRSVDDDDDGSVDDDDDGSVDGAQDGVRGDCREDEDLCAIAVNLGKQLEKLPNQPEDAQSIEMLTKKKQIEELRKKLAR